jgi:hypothetical protein
MTNRREELLDDLDRLLEELCVQWGFCNQLTAADLVSACVPLSGDDFANAVLEAEKMNPEYEPQWVRRIRERFAARFGPSISPAD